MASGSLLTRPPSPEALVDLLALGAVQLVTWCFERTPS